MKKWLFLIFVIILSSCEQKRVVGRYVYVSYTPPNGVIHIDKECSEGTVIKPACELYKEKSLRLSYSPNYDFCSKCISDEQMKQIEDSISKYRENEMK